MTENTDLLPEQFPTESNPASEPIDYFAPPERVRHYLPDGVQWVEILPMNEGAKAKFQRATSREMKINRDQSAGVKMDAAADRHQLIKDSVKDFYIVSGGRQLPFNPTNLNNVLTNFPPHIVDGIEKAIRKANPWLLEEMSSADIRKEIESLEEMLQVALEREAGEDGSSSK